jgi:hypothetical protein
MSDYEEGLTDSEATVSTFMDDELNSLAPTELDFDFTDEDQTPEPQPQQGITNNLVRQNAIDPRFNAPASGGKKSRRRKHTRRHKKRKSVKKRTNRRHRKRTSRKRYVK